MKLLIMLRQQSYNGLIIALTASAMASDSKTVIIIIAKPIDNDFENKLQHILEQGELWKRF